MKKFLTMTYSLMFACILSGQNYMKDPLSFNAIRDKFTSIPANDDRIGGYLGQKMDLVIEKRIKSQDVDHLIEPFRHRNETRQWQSEFWGKWIQSAIAAYNYNHDPELLTIIKNAVSGLLATQTPDGYIGNYSPDSQLQQWDIWGRKYTLLGLLAYYDISGDKAVLKAAIKLTDHLLTQVGPGKTDIVTTGNYRGMPSSSILEPVVYLYRRTGDRKYLDFAQYIADQWETDKGPHLLSKALDSVPVSERFPQPRTWWSYENGQKAYEMMSCYEGLLELYRITGRNDYLKAVVMTVNNIISDEINVAGSGSAFECFYKGAKYQDEPTYHTMETCVTMTWMKLCFSLLRLTGDPRYADQIEVSTYNALLASLRGDGTQIAKYSPLGGVRHAGEEQCGMHINCCNANGPRAFMMLPLEHIMKSDDGIVINMYGTSKTVVPVNRNNNITITETSDYPASDLIEIKIDPVKAEEFTLSLRIPAWSLNTTVSLNDKPFEEVKAGTYLKIKRQWNKNDRLIIKPDMRGRLVTLGSSQAILRGPVVLARDSRFNDGFIYECSVVSNDKGFVDVKPSADKPSGIWMSFTVPLVLGTDLEGEARNPKPVHFCDFASAGNTWGEDSRYKVWLPRTLNVMTEEYKGY